MSRWNKERNGASTKSASVKSSSLEDLHSFMTTHVAVDNTLESLQVARAATNEIANRIRSQTVVVFSTPEEAM